MTRLREYFFNDSGNNMTVHNQWPLSDGATHAAFIFIARAHFDFSAGALYMSYYIPEHQFSDYPELQIAEDCDEMASYYVNRYSGWGSGAGYKGAGYLMEVSVADLTFTRRLHFYSEIEVPIAIQSEINSRLIVHGGFATFRSRTYAEEQDAMNSPKAFISHDSRDKDEIARKLANALKASFCPVWYDEFSLNVGDNLRDSIEAGLKQCPKCIFLLTPNFLANGGWAKVEYDSIFTRELIERTSVILPIWSNVTKEMVYQYSPGLANKVALRWEDGLEVIVPKLVRALTPA